MWIDITPTTAVLHPIKMRKMTHAEFLGELIDNAIDANADRIWVGFQTSGQSSVCERFVIEDNGVGCDDLATVFTLGKRQQHKSTRIGMYGVGGSTSAVWWGDEIVVETVTKNGNRFYGEWRPTVSDWNRQAKVVEKGVRMNIGSTGFRMTIMQSTRRLREDYRENLVDSIRRRYFPFLRSGGQIRIDYNKNENELQSWTPSWQGDVREVVVDGPCGPIALQFGRVSDSSDGGYHYVYGPRVIEYGVWHPSPGITPSRFCCIATFSEGYAIRLADLKNFVADEDGMISSAISHATISLVREVGADARTMALTMLSQRLQSNFLSIFGKGTKERRDKGDTHGTVTPTDSGRTRTPNKTQNGEGAKKPAFQFQIEDLSGRAYAYQVTAPDRVTREQQLIVSIGSSHPFVAKALTTDNDDALEQLACVAVADAFTSNNSEMGFPKLFAKDLETIGCDTEMGLDHNLSKLLVAAANRRVRAA